MKANLQQSSTQTITENTKENSKIISLTENAQKEEDTNQNNYLLIKHSICDVNNDEEKKREKIQNYK